MFCVFPVPSAMGISSPPRVTVPAALPQRVKALIRGAEGLTGSWLSYVPFPKGMKVSSPGHMSHGCPVFSGALCECMEESLWTDVSAFLSRPHALCSPTSQWRDSDCLNMCPRPSITRYSAFPPTPTAS